MRKNEYLNGMDEELQKIYSICNGQESFQILSLLRLQRIDMAHGRKRWTCFNEVLKRKGQFLSKIE